MKALCLFVVYLLGAPLVAFAQDEHVRALDPWAVEALRLGIERSPTVRDLVAELEASDVIVHVETRAALPFSAVGTTRLSASTGSRRYVRIVLLRDPLPVNRVAVLGHELQHACEIARSPARDASGMRLLFDAIGRPAPGERAAYETEAAVKVTRVVWYEVHGDAKRAARARQVSGVRVQGSEGGRGTGHN
jgi:hypothetical protein